MFSIQHEPLEDLTLATTEHEIEDVYVLGPNAQPR